MKNEPITFADNVIIGLSTVADGDMRTAAKTESELSQVRKNQEAFLARCESTISRTTLVRADYETDDFRRYFVVDDAWAGRGMVANNPVGSADALATNARDLGLFLPLADCLGAVIYDSENGALMVTHLGRHATEQFGAAKSIEFMTQKFGSDPAKIKVWLSPAAGAKNYPLFVFGNRSLRNVNIEQFISAGISQRNISGNGIDTTTDENYFSHSMAQKTGENLGKRFAIVAKLLK